MGRDHEALRPLVMPGYRPRSVDAIVEGSLQRRGAVLIEGCRGCGKTWTARSFARSEARLDDEATLLLAEADPGAVMVGAAPRLLDEWQNAPGLWNRVRRECDDRAVPGQFLLTGSAAPQDDITRHTGVGRIARVLMRPMSLHESGLSDGSVSMQGLFNGEAFSAMPQSGRGLAEIAASICIGGWPASLGLDTEQALLAAGDYLNEIVHLELPAANGVTHNPAAVRRLMRSIARHTATEAKTSTLAADTDAEGPAGRNTVAAYLDALERVFVIEDQPAWSVQLRSRATLRRAAKRHFIDPSLSAHLLRVSPRRLLADPATLGLLFESLAVRDLRVYSQPERGEVYHYRDDTGLEVDAVIERDDGAWIAAEVKVSPGPDAVDAAARALLRLRSKVRPSRVDDLAAMVVVTSTGAAYRRPDGVQVVPIIALGP